MLVRKESLWRKLRLCFAHLEGQGTQRKLSYYPLRSSIKLQILLLCFHTFLTEVVGRSC